MSDRDRQIAERMGRQFGWKCIYYVPIRGRCGWHTWQAERPTTCGCGKHPFDGGPTFSPTTDANDREAAIAWLNAKGWQVLIVHLPNGNAQVLIRYSDTLLPVAEGKYGPIGEAFGEAFMAAMEEKA